MVVDLNKVKLSDSYLSQKVKVKLKYLIPEDQHILVDIDTYGDLESEITVKDLIDKTGMTLQEYRKKEPLVEKSTQLTLPFKYNNNQKSDKSHFEKIFDITQTAKFA